MTSQASKKGYMIGIPDNMDPFVKMKFFPQNAFDFCIISTDDHNVFSVPAAECYGYTESKNIPSVVVDDERGAYEMIRYLIAQGHKKSE